MNVCFADLLEISAEEFNEGEIDLISELEFRLRIPPEELANYLQKLQDYALSETDSMHALTKQHGAF